MRNVSRFLQPLMLLGCVLPLANLVVDGWQHDLTANPVEEALNRLGFWAFCLLLASQACTPLRLVGIKMFMKVRRTLGLCAFAYASAHLLLYAVADQSLDVGDIVDDVTKRPFIAVGATAWVLLLALAVTSTKGWVKRLGGHRWKRLHRLAYAATAQGLVHFVWRMKVDVTLPVGLACLWLGLMAIRVRAWWRGRTAA